MLRPTKLEELPADKKVALTETTKIVSAYLQGLGFIVQDTGRDPKYLTTHLLSYLAQDFLQSATSLISLAMEGLGTVAKRELRFIIESSIKLCFVQQKNYSSTVAGKLTEFEGVLSSQRISVKDNLKLGMLPVAMRDAFVEEVGRLYGQTSKYTHLTPSQIRERVAAVDAGRTAGFESVEDIERLNDLMSRCLSVSLVLIFHSVPDYVVGDWFVEENGRSVGWHFMGSRFVSELDAFFDYKAERQPALSQVQQMRASGVRF